MQTKNITMFQRIEKEKCNSHLTSQKNNQLKYREETGSLQFTEARDDAKDASRLDLACPWKNKYYKSHFSSETDIIGYYDNYRLMLSKENGIILYVNDSVNSSVLY